MIRIILLLCLFQIVVAKQCPIDRVPEMVAWEKKLREDLKCGYQASKAPTNNSTEPVKVAVRFRMGYFTFDSDLEVFSVQVVKFMSWQDDRLKWKPEDYGGLNDTEIMSSTIWYPEFRLNNSVNHYYFDGLYHIGCRLKSTGEVKCVPRKFHEARCNVKLKDWPYDAQNCSLNFKGYSLYTKASDFQMTVSKRAMSMFGADYGAEWMISDYKQSLDDSRKNIKMTFTIVREATGLAAIVVYPSLILTTLTIATLLLDFRNNMRLWFSCFNVFCHYEFLIELAIEMPRIGSESPTLLLYYRGSYFLAIICVFLTLVLSIVCKKSTETHNFIITINNFVFEGFLKYLVFPQWLCEMEDGDQNFKVQWMKFANIVNWVFTVIFVLTYIGMYASFMPQPIPFN